MFRKYAVHNIRRITTWVDAGLEFVSPNSRQTKKNRRKINEAIAALKGFGFLRTKRVEATSYQTVVVDLRKINEFIYRTHCEMVERYGCKDCVIIMGSPEFHELTNTMLTMPASFPLADFQVGHLQNRYLGMSIVVLPWMTGTVFVPKEYLPIDRELIPSGVMVTAETQKKLQEERDAWAWNRFMGRDYDPDLE